MGFLAPLMAFSMFMTLVLSQFNMVSSFLFVLILVSWLYSL
jgi:hypothetical protein